MSEPLLLELLAERYCAPAWAFFPNVRSATGFAREPRTADAIAMSTWPSRGLELHGFECKSSRGDWLRELKQPEKSEDIQRYMDRWWIVVDDQEIVTEGELPPTWGLMAAKGRRLKVVREAPKLEATPISRAFLAALLRRVLQTYVAKASIGDVVEAEKKAIEERWVERLKQSEEWSQRELKSLQETVRAFEEASGVRVNQWNTHKVGEAVRFVLDGGVGRSVNQLVRLRDDTQRILAGIDAVLAEAPEQSATRGAA